MSFKSTDGKLLFTPEYSVVWRLHVAPSNMGLEQEPMLYCCDYDYLKEVSGETSLARMFADRVCEISGETDWIFDSRVHMLMKGWYPCIPGWHTDFVPRTAHNKQPNYFDRSNEAVHYMMVVGDTSMTEFLDEPVILTTPPEGSTYYGHWNDEIKAANPKTHFIQSGEIVKFDCNDWHRGVAADKSAWRFFIRANRQGGRPVVNKIRKQTQVYLQAVEGGW